MIFCTAKLDLDQQERTRVFQLSPETDASKVDAALDLLLEKKSDRDMFRERLLADGKRLMLTRRVLDVKNAGLRDVIIPSTLRDRIRKTWKELHSHSIPRHTRDLDRFLSLVKAAALLNWRSRKASNNNRVEASLEDVDEALGIYREIAEANELGLAPQVFEIYREVIQPLGTAKLSDTEVVTVGVSRRAIQKEYFRLYHRSLVDTRLRREILPSLDASGLISEEPDANDKRQMLVCPQRPAPISRARGIIQPRNNRGPDVGVQSWTENPPLLHPNVRRGSPDSTSTLSDHVVDPPVTAPIFDTTPPTVEQAPERGSLNANEPDDPGHNSLQSDLEVNDKPRVPAITTNGTLRTDPNLVSEFVLTTVVPLEMATVGYAVESKIRYQVRQRYGDPATTLVSKLLAQLEESGRLEQKPRAGCWRLKK